MTDGHPSCPKCGGVSGFQWTQVEKFVYHASWSIPEDAEAVDSEICTDRYMPMCLDCGKTMRWATVEAICGEVP